MAEKEKKRKRPSTGVDDPDKRTSLDQGQGISVSIDRDHALRYPMIANTPGLILQPNTFEIYSKGKDNTNSLLDRSIFLQSSKHPLLDYTAISEEDGRSAHYLAIYDPSHQSIRLMPAYQATVRSTLRSERLEVQAQSDLLERTKAKQREELGLEFGTKKSKKAIQSRTINAITGDSATGLEAAVLGYADATANAPGRVGREEEIMKAKPIPKPYLEAEQPQDVYSLSTLIHAGDLRILTVKDWQDKIEADDEVVTSSRFVAHRVRTVVQKNNTQMLKALKYLLLLIEFTRALKVVKSGRKVPKSDILKDKLSEWPHALVENVRRTFAQGGELNKWHTDRLMTHMAAISLYIDGYRSDTHDLREDLHLDNKEMSQYFHELGCKIRSPTEKELAEFRITNKAQAAQHKVAQLRIPLDFPKVRKPPRRR